MFKQARCLGVSADEPFTGNGHSLCILPSRIPLGNGATNVIQTKEKVHLCICATVTHHEHIRLVLYYMSLTSTVDAKANSSLFSRVPAFLR